MHAVWRLPDGASTATDTCDSPGNEYEALQQGQLRKFPLAIFESFKADEYGFQKKLGVKGQVVVEEDVTGDESLCRPAMGGLNSAECNLAFDTTARLVGNTSILGNATFFLRAGEPTPWNFHQRRMKLTFRRSPYTYDCPAAGCDTSLTNDLDVITVERWVPVLGNMLVSGDVPKTFTVPTRDRLVFNVLHDPPVRLRFFHYLRPSFRN